VSFRAASTRKNAKSALIGYLFILPAVAFFVVFSLVPLVNAVSYSFYKWDGVGRKIYLGLGNYIAMAKEPLMGLSLFNNAAYTLGIILFGVFPGIFLAHLLTREARGRLFYRTVYFLPRIVSAVVYGAVWQWIYNPLTGLLKRAAEIIGSRSFDLAVLGNPRTAMLGIVIAGGWTYFGFCMVILLAAFQGVDRELQESAVLDGANGVQIFFDITLPAVMPVLTMLIIFTVIDSFKVFDLVLVMTSGGPADATSIMTFYIYKQAFKLNNFGYASAVSVVLALVILVFSVLYQNRQETRETR
jgi:raffinose/stachyose/melibiose transport system permease protein